MIHGELSPKKSHRSHKVLVSNKCRQMNKQVSVQIRLQIIIILDCRLLLLLEQFMDLYYHILKHFVQLSMCDSEYYESIWLGHDRDLVKHKSGYSCKGIF